jgi:hypothetical protein
MELCMLPHIGRNYFSSCIGTLVAWHNRDTIHLFGDIMLVASFAHHIHSLLEKYCVTHSENNLAASFHCLKIVNCVPGVHSTKHYIFEGIVYVKFRKRLRYFQVPICKQRIYFQALQWRQLSLFKGACLMSGSRETPTAPKKYCSFSGYFWAASCQWHTSMIS